METKERGKVYPLAMTAVMTAVMAVVSPFSLPIGPIPISRCNFVIYLTTYVLGWKRATTATLVYVLLGAVGAPVFSGFGAGLGKVLGPTGGYIVGYIFLALVAGLFVEKFPDSRVLQLVGMVVGTAVLYALGTAWFCVQGGKTVGYAMAYCVIPFLAGDAAKIIVTLVVGPLLRRRLAEAGLDPAA